MPKKRARVNTNAAQEQDLLAAPRFVEVTAQLQQMLDQEFIDGKYRREFKFHPGDAILCVCEGLYHEGEVLRYGGAVQRPDLIPVESVGAEEDVWIPTYIVVFTGLPENNKVGGEEKVTLEVLENELLRRVPEGLVNIFGMLFAHEWNVRKCETEQRHESTLVFGAWLMDKDSHAALNTAWKVLTGETIDFIEYCGRNITPTMVNG